LLAPGPQQEEGIGTLFSRLIDEGRELVRAEIGLYRQITLNRLLRSRTAVVLAVAAVLLAQASVTTLLVGVLFALAWWLGPIGGGLVVAALGLLTSWLLLRAALKRFADATDMDDGEGKRP
jgi:small-conductance mechanosensitive channel